MENFIRRRNSSFSRVLNALGQWVAEFHSNVIFAIQRVGQPLAGESFHFPRLELFTPVDTEDSRVPVLCDFFVIIHVRLWQVLVTLENLHCQIKTAQGNYSLFKQNMF